MTSGHHMTDIAPQRAPAGRHSHPAAGEGAIRADRRVGRQMMLLVILVSLVPLVLAGIQSYSFFHGVYREKITAHDEELIERHAVAVDDYLKERLGNIRMRALVSPMNDLLRDDRLGFILKQMQAVYDESFVDMGVVDEHGRLVSYAGPFRLDKADYSQTDWFKGAMASETYVSDVFLGIRNVPHFVVAVAIHEGGKRWLLRATIDFAQFNELVKDIRHGRTGHAYIINRKGEFQTERRLDDVLPPEVLKEIASRELKPGRAYALTSASVNGVEYFFTAAPLKGGEWVMVLQQEASDALTHLITARRTFLVILLAGGAAIVGTSVYAMRRLLSRLFVAEKAQDAMRKQIVETGKLAAIGELASGIAHEINNPVAIMIEYAGWTQDLLDEEDRSSLKNYDELTNSLREVVIQGKRCKEITHKLLSFARKTDSVVKDVDVNGLLEEVIGFASQKARYDKIVVRGQFDRAIPRIMLSPTELQQVALNLINNAMDAIDKDEGVIEVRTRREGDFAVIDVQDNGQGIPASNMDRIFEPFYTTKPVGKGTGLGLSICYGIIDKMGGDITVESAPGQGATFHVYVPLTPNSPGGEQSAA